MTHLRRLRIFNFDWIHHGMCNFNINQVLNEIKLLLENLSSFDSKIAHVFHAEVVRNVCVELA
jgi:hypothetical protein